MSLSLSSLSRKTAGLAIPTPVYADANDSPIDLRKKVAIRRSKYGYDHSNYQYHSDFSSSDEDDGQDHRRISSPTTTLPLENGLWSKRVLLDRTSAYHHPHHQPAFPTVPNPYHVLPLKDLHPVLSEQYGIQYALFASPEGTHVVPVPTQYASSAHLPHLRASLAMPDIGKRNYFSSNQRHVIDDDEEIRRHVYYREEQVTNHRPLKQAQDSEFRIRDSVGEDRYPWRKIQSSNVYRNSGNSPTLVADRPRYLPKCYSNEDFHGSIENSRSNDGVIRSPQERQPRQRLKTPVPTIQLKRRTRSLSLSHLRKKSPQTMNKYIIHPGYSSDNESSTKSKVSSPSQSSSPLKSNGHLSMSLSKKRKVINGNSVDGSGSDSDTTTRHPKTDRTLLNLLAAAPSNTQKRDSEVLLRQLQRSPVNHSIGKDGYPWSVYEYYNHLVEKFRDRSFQRSPTDFRPYGHSSPPAATPSMLIPGLPVDEDSIGREQRKRPTRALTGKHVKHGTGASPSTLITLRQKIQERQRAKELLSIGIDHHHRHQEAPVKIAKNGNCKKPKQGGNLKRLKQDQNGTASIRDLHS